MSQTMRKRRRYFSADLTYSEWHRDLEPSPHFGRVGHRLNLADRDWTEFCVHCREPLAIYEEVRDVGQNLADKATVVTQRLARRAGIPGMLMAWRTSRPREVDDEIERLSSRIRDLEREWPITGFTIRRLTPTRGDMVAMTPREWADEITSLHVEHWSSCQWGKQEHLPL